MADADVLFAEHRQGVYRYLCRIVGQPDAAHDLTQEVFLRVARSRVPEGPMPRGAARFAVEAVAAVRVSGAVVGQDFDGDCTVEASVAGAIDFAHSSGAEDRHDLVRAETGA